MASVPSLVDSCSGINRQPDEVTDAYIFLRFVALAVVTGHLLIKTPNIQIKRIERHKHSKLLKILTSP